MSREFGLPTPENQINPLGRELTEKISKLVHHPTSDMPDRLIDEVHLEHGADMADEMSEIGNSWVGAYYSAENDEIAYLEMPEPGTQPFFEDEPRWKIHIKTDVTAEGNFEIVRMLHVVINELSYEVEYSEESLIYNKDGKLIRDISRKQFIQDADMNIVEAHDKWAVMQREKKEQASVYSKEMHEQILEVLDSFKLGDEVQGYNPANGHGIFYKPTVL